MAKLRSLTARKVVQALKRAGFVEDRQKGSHPVLIHPTQSRTVVPIHPGHTIKGPLLRAIIRDANLSVDEFIEPNFQGWIQFHFHHFSLGHR